MSDKRDKSVVRARSSVTLKTDRPLFEARCAIAYVGSGMVKRLRQMPNGNVKILSDNPATKATSTDQHLVLSCS